MKETEVRVVTDELQTSNDPKVMAGKHAHYEILVISKVAVKVVIGLDDDEYPLGP
jgi:hypothetical protein